MNFFSGDSHGQKGRRRSIYFLKGSEGERSYLPYAWFGRPKTFPEISTKRKKRWNVCAEDGSYGIRGGLAYSRSEEVEFDWRRIET